MLTNTIYFEGLTSFERIKNLASRALDLNCRPSKLEVDSLPLDHHASLLSIGQIVQKFIAIRIQFKCSFVMFADSALKIVVNYIESLNKQTKKNFKPQVCMEALALFIQINTETPSLSLSLALLFMAMQTLKQSFSLDRKKSASESN